MMTALTIFAAAVTTLAADTKPCGNETWGNRKAHPAVVNSVTAIPGDPNVVSLRGTWDFAAIPSANIRNIPWSDIFLGTGNGIWEGKRQGNGCVPKTCKAEVPSCWEAQLGGTNETMGRAWGSSWDCSPALVRGYHCGDGWYRRTVTLPAGWRGRRVWLKTGWVNSAGWFYLNGEQVALDHNYCATYKYDVTDLVKFGETNLVVVQVNNECPSHRGCMNSKNHWGGILRDIEFEATPAEVWIDDAWVRGDFDTMTAEVHVELGGNTNLAKVVTSVPTDLKPWSPEHPNLYTARVDLVSLDGKILQTRFERFGIRKIEIRGTEVFLNGKPFYLRGAGWHTIDPIGGYDRPDRATWLKQARQVRAAGFNIVRNHTHCKMPEYYEACDEAGLMVEAELPYYGDIPSDLQRFDPLADAEMLYRHFRRHPSFAIYSFGNEGGFGSSLDRRLYEEVKGRDPDRLVICQDGTYGFHPTNREGTSDFAGAPIRVRPRGYYAPGRPFFYHEYINSSVKLDTRIADEFTGVWVAPITRDARLKFLKEFGLDHRWGDRLQDGQNAMQALYLKYGLESARLDKYACGYSYWSLQDACSPQGGTSIGQGLYDPFWHEKRYGAKTADVAVYNSPSCVLMTDGADVQDYSGGVPVPAHFGAFVDSTITNLVRVSGEVLKARFHFAHFGDAALSGAMLLWRLEAEGRILAQGERAIGDQPLGGVRFVGAEDIAIPAVEKPVKAKLVATVVAEGGFSQSNGWTYWLFPVRAPKDGSRILCAAEFHAALASRYAGLVKATDGSAVDFSACDAVIAPFGSDLERAALAAGKSVVALANQKTELNIKLGWWYMTEQMGAAFADSPALARLPHDGVFNQLFFRIGRTGLKLPVKGFAADDFLMVGEGGTACYLYIAQKSLGARQRHGLVAGVDVLSDTPEGAAILDGLLTSPVR